MLRVQSFNQFACIRVVYLCQHITMKPALRPIPGVRFIMVDAGAHDFRRAIVLNEPVTRLAQPGEKEEERPDAMVRSPRALYRALKDADLVFLVTCGEQQMLEEVHYVATMARQIGALSVGVLSRGIVHDQPGWRRTLKRWRRYVDTVVFVPAESMNRTDILAESALIQGIRGISEVISKPGLINVDFADVHAILSMGDTAILSAGRADGSDGAWEVVRQLLEGDEQLRLDGAQGVLLNLTGGPALSLHDMKLVAEVVRQYAHPEANVIIGTVVDYDMGDELSVTLMATGFASDPLATPAWEPEHRHALPYGGEATGKETPRERVWERWWPAFVQVPPSLAELAPVNMQTT